MANKRKIFILTSLAGPAEALVPVIEELEATCECIVVGLETENELFQNAGGSHKVFKKHFAATHNYSDLIGSDGNISGMLERFTPDAVLLGCVPDPDGARDFPEKHFVDIAREKRIPSAQFIDGWMAWSPRSACPDSFFVIDQISADLPAKLFNGKNGYDVTVVGHPGLAQFHSSHSNFEKLPNENLTVCYFTQVNVDTEEVLEWFANLLGPGDSLYIKNHPRDKTDYEKFRDSLVCSYEILAIPPEEIFGMINVSVTHTSVVGLKSAILRIPTINIKPREHMKNIYDLIGGYPLSVAGLSVEVNTVAELQVALSQKSCVSAEEMKSWFHLDDATQRLVSEINKMGRK